MSRPPDDAQRPPAGKPGGEHLTSDLADRHQEPTRRVGHDPDTCATCRPRPRTLGPVLRARAKDNAQPAPISYIGNPARQMAGQILAGDLTISEAAHQMVEMLGEETSARLARELVCSITPDPT